MKGDFLLRTGKEKNKTKNDVTRLQGKELRRKRSDYVVSKYPNLLVLLHN